MSCLTDPSLLNPTLTDREIIDKLEELIQREEELKTLFRQQREALEALVQPITDHVRECMEFWTEDLGNPVGAMFVDIDENIAIKLVPPDFKRCSVETFLPFGINYSKEDFTVVIGYSQPTAFVVTTTEPNGDLH